MCNSNKKLELVGMHSSSNQRSNGCQIRTGIHFHKHKHKHNRIDVGLQTLPKTNPKSKLHKHKHVRFGLLCNRLLMEVDEVVAGGGVAPASTYRMLLLQ